MQPVWVGAALKGTDSLHLCPARRTGVIGYHNYPGHPCARAETRMFIPLPTPYFLNGTVAPQHAVAAVLRTLRVKLLICDLLRLALESSLY